MIAAMSWDTVDFESSDHPGIVGAQAIGRVLRRRREQLGLSQRQLERLSGLDQSVISRLENGKTKGIRFGRFAFLVGSLGGLDPSDPWPLTLGLQSLQERQYPTVSPQT